MARREDVIETVCSEAYPLRGSTDPYAPIMAMIKDARFVLIGEASHGTHEFYRHRAELTQRLIQQKGFQAVAAEADWPDAFRVNRYVKGRSDDPDANSALRPLT